MASNTIHALLTADANDVWKLTCLGMLFKLEVKEEMLASIQWFASICYSRDGSLILTLYPAAAQQQATRH